MPLSDALIAVLERHRHSDIDPATEALVTDLIRTLIEEQPSVDEEARAIENYIASGLHKPRLQQPLRQLISRVIQEQYGWMRAPRRAGWRAPLPRQAL